MKTFEELINSETPTLVDFYADWCAPCRTMAPVLEQAGNLFEDSVKVIKVNTDKNARVSEHFGIRSIPTLLLFQKGEVIWRHSGTMSLQDLTATLMNYAPQKA
ncbi:MAG: thioredoxin [Bacteroidetes bacterium]|nr:MAG: thioredoxin [Bacteroidota bacterium]